MEHLIAAQPHFFVVSRSHSRPLDRHLLPHHHTVAALAAPPVGLPFRLLLAALADQFSNFFLHHQIHQLQAGLTYHINAPTPLRSVFSTSSAWSVGNCPSWQRE